MSKKIVSVEGIAPPEAPDYEIGFDVREYAARDRTRKRA
jgi:hypothetical protein